MSENHEVRNLIIAMSLFIGLYIVDAALVWLDMYGLPLVLFSFYGGTRIRIPMFAIRKNMSWIVRMFETMLFIWIVLFTIITFINAITHVSMIVYLRWFFYSTYIVGSMTVGALLRRYWELRKDE